MGGFVIIQSIWGLSFTERVGEYEVGDNAESFKRKWSEIMKIISLKDSIKSTCTTHKVVKSIIKVNDHLNSHKKLKTHHKVNLRHFWIFCLIELFFLQTHHEEN